MSQMQIMQNTMLLKKKKNSFEQGMQGSKALELF